MNNYVNNLRIMIMGMIITLTSCSGSDELVEEPTSLAPNEHVLRAFDERYPNAQNVSWSEKEDYFVAEFVSNYQPAVTWFNTQGDWVLGLTGTSQNNLQEFVSKTTINSKYSDWEAIDAYKLERQGFSSVYRVGIEKNNQKSNLYFTLHGDFIKVIEDTYTYTESPVIIPEQLNTTINRLFDRPQLIDIEWNELIESDINVGVYENGIFKLAILSRDYSWISTFWNLTEQTIPANIYNSFTSSKYGTNDIDNIKVMENDSGLFYLFYFRDANKENKHTIVTLDDAGNIKTTIHY